MKGPKDGKTGRPEENNATTAHSFPTFGLPVLY